MLGLDVAEQIRRRIEARAEVIAAQLVSDDRRLGAQTAVDVMCSLYPGETGPEPQWWLTPLGAAVALTYRPGETVSYGEAAKILGVSRTRVVQPGRAGKLTWGTTGV